MNRDIMEEWKERSRRRGLSGRRDRGGALAVRELAGEEEEAMDKYEDHIDKMTKEKQVVNANCRLLYGICL